MKVYICDICGKRILHEEEVHIFKYSSPFGREIEAGEGIEDVYEGENYSFITAAKPDGTTEDIIEKEIHMCDEDAIGLMRHIFAEGTKIALKKVTI